MFNFILPTKPVQAADFSATGLGDIVSIWLHDNGNVRAIDESGKVAEFNYVAWEVINTGFPKEDGFGSVYTSYDPISRRILLGRGESPLGYWSAFSYIYNIDNNSWENRSHYSYVNGGKAYKIINRREGGYHIMGIEEYNSNGILLKTVWYDSVKINSGGIGWSFHSINDVENYILAVGDDGTLSRKLTIINKNGQVVYNGNMPSAVQGLYYTSKGGYGVYADASFVGSNRRINGYNCYNNQMSSTLIYRGKQNGYYSYGINHGIGNKPYTGITISMQNEVNELYSIYINETKITDKAQHRYNVASYDKFGNLILGGETGRVIVISQGGVLTTDSNFYTDYLISFSAEEARLAKEAAQRAEAKANQSLQEINHNEYGLKKLNEKFNNIKLDIPPKITKVSGKNNATATINSTMEIIIDAEDATKYRARANAIPNNINWETSNTLSVGGLKQGANTIHVQATNESGKVTNHKITIFRIK